MYVHNVYGGWFELIIFKYTTCTRQWNVTLRDLVISQNLHTQIYIHTSTICMAADLSDLFLSIQHVEDN